jgi:pyruvate/2-oxoglutarate dehydrogenase complex dihydrolipoamide dehydrogenase (E3) component
MTRTDVVVIGAGPNGLSVAAHLNSAGIEHRVFGRTMGAWRFNMPMGMILKSEPYASDLSAPQPGFLAGDYCRAAHEEFHERVVPLSRAQFVNYGSWFARHLVPGVEETEVVSLTRPSDHFVVRTADDTTVVARRVVVATGVIPFAYLPPELANFSRELVSHTSAHTDLSVFNGREVLVVGGGQSALETAALLFENGAAVRITMRGSGAFWPRANPVAPTRLQRLKRPVVRLCEGWPCWRYDRLPDLFRLLPEPQRVDRGLGFLGPAGAWWLRERVEGRIPIMTQQALCGAEVAGDRIRVHLGGHSGITTEEADHVIAGTGFRFDLARLTFLDAPLRAGLKLVAGAPLLDRGLESNVPGLHFTGALAAPSMGPLMRFVAGTHFTGPRVAHRLRTTLGRPGNGTSRRHHIDVAHDGRSVPSAGTQPGAIGTRLSRK